jgi:pSer/pThr/pTyr-binding forkhead associated (FHA) protein/ribosomal protein L40E
VCGSENDERLIFCRNCGHRLKKREARAVPPTPAVALPAASVPKPDEAPVPEPEPHPTEDPAVGPLGAVRPRPSAPALFLRGGDKAAAQPQRGSEAPVAGASLAPKPTGSGVLSGRGVEAGAVSRSPVEELRCSQCGTTSPKGYRFCLGCGSVLLRPESRRDAATTPATASGDAGPAPARATHAQAPPLTAQPVLPIGSEPMSACPKCGAVSPLAASSCSRCGATLPRQTDRGLGQEKPAPPSAAASIRKISAPSSRAPTHTGVDPAVALPFELTAKRRREPDPPSPTAPARPTGRTDRPAGRSAGQPGDPITGRLVVIVEDGSEGAALELRGEQMDLGRLEGDIVFGEDRYMSSRHARMLRRDGGWTLRDLGSTNGIYRRIRGPEVLKDRDLVLLGLEVLEFQLVEHAERGLGHAMQHGTLVFGSPAASRPARLCQRTVEGIIRDVYHLVSDETTIGREVGDIVFTSDPFMSRRHAAIQWQEAQQRYLLNDLSSSNGTYLAIRGEVRLAHGDFLRIGQHLFRVDIPPTGAPARP